MNIKKLEIETPLKKFSQYHHGKKAFLDYFGKGLEGQSGRDDSKQTFFSLPFFHFFKIHIIPKYHPLFRILGAKAFQKD